MGRTLDTSLGSLSKYTKNRLLSGVFVCVICWAASMGIRDPYIHSGALYENHFGARVSGV
ncbi:hypothetical protein FBY04_12777 [Pseudomonas sp. SJZ080]|nr:hypothetical protein FBY04_12777 [Pseudomonas sp. SJZ080]